MTMKRLRMLLPMLMLYLILAACGGGGGAEITPAADVTAAQAAQAVWNSQPDREGFLQPQSRALARAEHPLRKMRAVLSRQAGADARRHAAVAPNAVNHIASTPFSSSYTIFSFRTIPPAMPISVQFVFYAPQLFMPP